MQNIKRKNWAQRHKVLTAIIVIVGLFVLAGALTPDKVEVNTTTPTVAVPTVTRWDGSANYDKIQTGQSREEVESLIQKTSSSCTTSETSGTGTIDICSYGNSLTDRVTISVTYLNGAVYTKTKIDL